MNWIIGRREFFMKKLLYLLGIIVAVLFVWEMYDRFAENRNVEDKPVVSEVVNRVFSAEGIKESDCIVEGYYYYGTNYLGEEGCHELLDEIAKKLGVNTEYEYYREKTDTGYTATLTKEGADSLLVLKLITVENEESENVISQKQYLSINLEINNSIDSAFHYQKNVASIIKNILEENESLENRNASDDDKSGNLSLSIKGKIYGLADIEQQKRIAKEMLKEFGAVEIFDNVVENKESDRGDMYSLYGYTKEISDYVSIGNQKINVNIAFNYDENNNETIIHIGSPIVNYDY